MRLLVSVTNAEEADAASRGGADVIDAKDPFAGPLGAVSLATFRDIVYAVDGRRPVSAALGDARDESSIRELAAAFASAGASVVKVGFAGHASPARLHSLLAACIEGVRVGSQGERLVPVFAVAYADAANAGTVTVETVAGIAAAASAHGLLIDTFDKTGPGVRQLAASLDLQACIASAHLAGLMVAVAGRLSIGELGWAHSIGADIAGVRGAACVEGRLTSVSRSLVEQLAWEAKAASLAATTGRQGKPGDVWETWTGAKTERLRAVN